jgi:hypothetical protein
MDSAPCVEEEKATPLRANTSIFYTFYPLGWNYARDGTFLCAHKEHW